MRDSNANNWVGSFPSYCARSYNGATLLHHMYRVGAEAVCGISQCTSGKQMFQEERMDGNL